MALGCFYTPGRRKVRRELDNWRMVIHSFRTLHSWGFSYGTSCVRTLDGRRVFSSGSFSILEKTRKSRACRVASYDRRAATDATAVTTGPDHA